MSFKQFLIENLARTNALKKQQELIDADIDNVNVDKLPGGVYCVYSRTTTDGIYLYCTPDGRVEDISVEQIDKDKILSSASDASYYAQYILKAPFPAGEPAIATDAHHAFFYARDILKAPWPAGEPAIATDLEFSCYYAIDVLKGPFPAGEAMIKKDSYFSKYYVDSLLTLKRFKK